MKTAVKVLSVLGLILVGIILLVMIILTVNIGSLIDYSYEAGTLYYNGSLATASDVEMMKNVFRGLFIFFDVFLALAAILPIVNLTTADSDNKTLHLVLGILDIVLFAFVIVGIVQIIIFAESDSQKEQKTVVIE